VLDTFAVIALVQDEPGAEQVERLLADAEAGAASLHMCSVNVAEVLYALWRRGNELAARVKVADLQLVGVQFHDATTQLSLQAGALKAQYPITPGDCFAAALAHHSGATLVPVVTELRPLDDVLKFVRI